MTPNSLLPQIPQSYNLPSPGLASSVYDSLRSGGGAHQILTHGHANTTLLAGMSHPNLAGAAGILASYQTRQVAAAAGAPQHSPSTRAGPDRPPCNLSTSSVDVHTSSVELSRSRSSSVELVVHRARAAARCARDRGELRGIGPPRVRVRVRVRDGARVQVRVRVRARVRVQG